jgi:hypothetical protein
MVGTLRFARSSSPAQSGVSSTPRLFDFIAGVSGILDRPRFVGNDG